MFGQTATGLARAQSDIDIAVYVRDRPPAAPFGSGADLAAALMRELGTNAVDVVILNEAPPLRYHRVLRDGVRILSRGLGCYNARQPAVPWGRRMARE